MSEIGIMLFMPSLFGPILPAHKERSHPGLLNPLSYSILPFFPIIRKFPSTFFILITFFDIYLWVFFNCSIICKANKIPVTGSIFVKIVSVLIIKNIVHDRHTVTQTWEKTTKNFKWNTSSKHFHFHLIIYDGELLAMLSYKW